MIRAAPPSLLFELQPTLAPCPINKGADLKMSRLRGVAQLLRAASTSMQQAAPCTSALAGTAQLSLLQAAKAATTAWAPPSMRMFSNTSGTLSNLGSLLADEIKHEKEGYAKPEAVAHGPPAPFTLSEAPGDTMLTLTRTFGSEQISVDLHVNNQPSLDDETAARAEEAGEEALNTVVFNVHVTKGDASLVFECESDGLFVAINHLSHEPKGGSDSDSIYSGPVFDELDDAVQDEFRGYLSERGISPEFGEYLRHLVYDKEMREYQTWLTKVSDFVAKK